MKGPLAHTTVERIHLWYRSIDMDYILLHVKFERRLSILVSRNRGALYEKVGFKSDGFFFPKKIKVLRSDPTAHSHDFVYQVIHASNISKFLKDPEPKQKLWRLFQVCFIDMLRLRLSYMRKWRTKRACHQKRRLKPRGEDPIIYVYRKSGQSLWHDKSKVLLKEMRIIIYSRDI